MESCRKVRRERSNVMVWSAFFEPLGRKLREGLDVALRLPAPLSSTKLLRAADCESNATLAHEEICRAQKTCNSVQGSRHGVSLSRPGQACHAPGACASQALIEPLPRQAPNRFNIPSDARQRVIDMPL